MKVARRAWEHPAGKAGVVLLALVASVAVAGPWLAGHDALSSQIPDAVGANGGPVGPSAGFVLGADRLFRDELARLAVAIRLSVGVATAATALATMLGTGVGALAGLAEGRALDRAVTTLLDAALGFPYLLLLLALGAALDRTTPATLFWVLGLSGWLGLARLVRAKVLEIRRRDFVTAAQALGASRFRIARLHVLPALGSTVIVVASFTVPQMILAESVLGYLGLGIAPPLPSLGQMVQEGQDTVATAPWLLAAPATALVAAGLGFNLVGEAVRDAVDRTA
jgi:peptide/nickel transport system permease protein